ncbi:MAG TPA: hypothetical protein VJ476_07340, partial [Rhizomicrobium sp.]|nr:hypothetical protein [Rhizomicrobium sp.]
KVPAMLAEIQATLFKEAKARLDANIRTDITTWDALAEYFGAGAGEDDNDEFKGWVRAPWCRATGAELDAIDARLKTLKLTLRNTPTDQPKTFGPCIFTGKPGMEEVLIARAY